MKYLTTIILLIIGLNSSPCYSNWYKLSQVDDFKFFTNENFQVYIDTKNHLSLNEFLKVKEQIQTKNEGYNSQLGSTYWLEFKFVNDTKNSSQWIFELVDPHIGKVNFYDLKNDLTVRQGYVRPFNSKYYQHKNHTFDVKLPPGDSTILYVKTSGKGFYGFGVKLQTYRNFTNYSLKEYFFLGAFYGLLFIMALYNFVLFIFTRNKVRLFYSFYVLGCSLISLSEDCIGFQFIWPDIPFVNIILGPVGPMIYLAMFVLYTQSFLGSRMIVLKRSIIASVSFFIIFYTITHVLDLYPRYWVSVFLIPLVLTLYQEIKEFIAGHKEVRFLLIGTSLVVISFVILQLRSYGLQSTFFLVYFFNFTVIAEVILFSMAIGEKMRQKNDEHAKGQELVINTLRKNEALKNKVNLELEEKIKERTVDLEEAKEKLAQQAKEISEMNLRLDSDNRTLSKEMSLIAKRRILGIEVDPNEFKKVYPDKLSCYKFLEEQKWINGFVCKKCQNTTFSNGSSLRSRRCSKCGTTETPTSRTIFHGLRMPIESAFYLLALTVNSKGELSSTALSEKTGVNQKACWNFKQKVLSRMEDGNYNKKGWVGLIFDN